MLYSEPRYRFAGDRGLMVELGDGIDWGLCRRVHALNRAVAALRLPGVIETVPAYRCLLVIYNPLILPYARLLEAVKEAVTRLSEYREPPVRRVTIPVGFTAEFGPDLADVAHLTGYTVPDLLSRFNAAEYRVFFLGFAPGTAYFGGLPLDLSVPRLESPRLHVPAGSVGIGGEQMGIYPRGGPGGYRLLGRTPVPLYDPAHPECSLLHVGDLVSFRPVSADEYQDICREVAAGMYVPEVAVVSSDHEQAQ